MKRRSLDIQKKIYLLIKEHPGITLSALERKVRTNPSSLKEHCEHLAYFGLIKIQKTERTTKLISS